MATTTDGLIELYNEALRAERQRPSGWNMTEEAMVRIDAEKKSLSSSKLLDRGSSPPTFLGLPIRVIASGPPVLDLASVKTRYVPCRSGNTKYEWDIFDLDHSEPIRSPYLSEIEAQSACATLHAEMRSAP